MGKQVEHPDDADEAVARGKRDEPAEEYELDGALLQKAGVEMRESQIFPGVPLS